MKNYNHALVWHGYNGYGYYTAECTCTNPDGDGVGRVDWTGGESDVLDGWLEHLVEEGVY